MDTKSKYETRLFNQLNEWDKQISQLKENADHASDMDTRAGYNG